MRTYQLDTSIEDLIKQLQSSDFQFGAVLGRLGIGQRDLIYTLLRVPPATKEGAQKASREQEARNRQIQGDSLLEYLHRLVLLLTGGVHLCGLYVAGADFAAADAASKLSTALSSFAAERGESFDGALLLHINPSTKKLTGKEYSAQGKGRAVLKPCEVRYQDLEHHMVLLTCRHKVDLRLSVPSSQDSLSSFVVKQLLLEAERVRSSTATVDGAVTLESASVLDTCVRRQEGQTEVQLLCIPSCAQMVPDKGTAAQETRSTGQLRIKGTIAGRCFAFDREPLNHAAELLKEDLAQTLQARGDLLLTEAESVADGREAALLHPASEQEYNLSLPQRAFFPAHDSWLQLSDCYFPGEGDEEVQATAKEVLSLNVAAGRIEWPERLQQHSGATTKQDVGSGATELGEGRPPVPFGLKSGQQALTLAVIVCVISCFLSYLIARASFAA